MSALAVTESRGDVARLRGRVIEKGILAATESSSDRFGAAGGLVPGAVVTLMQQIEAALRDLAAGGAWPGRAGQQPQPTPYITFFRVVRPNEMTFDGPTDMQPTRVQIESWSGRYGEAASVGRAVRDRMLEHFQIGEIVEQDFPPDPETDLFRVSQDFIVWSRAA